MEYWDKIYLTEVETMVEGDVLFPETNPEEWREISRESHGTDEKNEHPYTFIVLERIDT